MAFIGMAYPITKHPLGFFHSQSGLEQIKSDLLVLLLTNPGERVMLPDFGTPLRNLVFEPNDPTIVNKTRQMIAESIRKWEPRVQIEDIIVSNTIDAAALDPNDTLDEVPHILSIVIRFFDPNDIDEVEELKLQVPLS